MARGASGLSGPGWVRCQWRGGPGCQGHA